jgi:Kef-type K+ transport system membrane component KefB
MLDCINLQVFFEAIVVGIVTIIFGKLIYYAMRYIADKFPTIRTHMFIAIFFLTGFVMHLSFEYIGLNSYYCRYGNACKNKK